MIRKAALWMLLLVVLLLPAGALAHEGHGEVKLRQQVMAGPYPVTVEYNQWPVKAGMHLEVAVIPEGGIAGKSGRWKLIPAPNVYQRTIGSRLRTYPAVADGWTIQIGGIPGNPGRWTWEFEIDGPEGKGVGRLDWAVADPPYFPMWLGWLLGLFPLYGLLWFVLREWRRVRREILADSGARG